MSQVVTRGGVRLEKRECVSEEFLKASVGLAVVVGFAMLLLAIMATIESCRVDQGGGAEATKVALRQNIRNGVYPSHVDADGR